ncbi:MAG: hypothetical protein EOO06_00645 [Chitinophagaceae bacterium]|nr:MAG: hypothetical protein EOO06_00645 [Chitinophagaceae bacterium]
MANLFNYIPEEVSVLLAGILPIDGFVDGTFVSIDKDVMPFTSVRMPDGSMARKYVNSQNYTLNITLHSGSDSNDILTKLWQLDEISQRGKFPILVKDSSGSDLFFSLTSWIEGLPTLSKSSTIDSRVWTIKCASAVINIGGNGEESSLINDLLNIASSALPALEGIL